MDGTLLVHVPLQIFTPQEADEIAKQLKDCAELARQAKTKAKDGKPFSFPDLMKPRG